MLVDSIITTIEHYIYYVSPYVLLLFSYDDDLSYPAFLIKYASLSSPLS